VVTESVSDRTVEYFV